MKPREPRVLVVDAGEGTVAETASLLTVCGFMAFTASLTGLWDEVQRVAPDVVIVGEATVEEARAALGAQEGGRWVPFVVLGRAAGGQACGGPTAMSFRLHDEPIYELLGVPFTPRELAAYVIGAARIKRLRDEFRARERALGRLAIRDRVTGVFTRAYGLERAKQEVARGKRYGYAVSCLRLSVKEPSGAGEPPATKVGEDVLRQVAAILLRLTREADVVCRSYGERFLLLLPQTDRSGLEVLAERIRLAVERHHFGGDAAGRRVTALIGGATFPSPEVSGAGSLVWRAGEAMRLARRDGRGQVVVL